MTSTAIDEKVIYSAFGADPFMSELIEMYVAEMPGRVAALEEAFTGREMEKLQRCAHQMKGAAGGYGFDPLTPAAAAVESAVRQGETLERIQHTLDELLRLCRQVRAGAPQ